MHQLKHTTLGENPYKCNMCQKTFSSSGNLRSHEKNHKKKETQQCKLCDKSFLKKSEFKEPAQVHIEEKQYSCYSC